MQEAGGSYKRTTFFNMPSKIDFISIINAYEKIILENFLKVL